MILLSDGMVYQYSSETTGAVEQFSLFCSRFFVASQEQVYVVGPNGSGKSTLLSVLSGERHPTEGSIRRGSSPTASIYAQDMSLLVGNLRVLDHLVAALELCGIYKDRVHRGIFYGWHERAVLEAMPTRYRWPFLAGALQKRVRFLSSGQQQLLILLLVALNPLIELVFADEPTSYLDEMHSEAFFVGLKGAGKAAIVVTHDIDAACRHADRIYLVDEGKVLSVDQALTEKISQPASKILNYVLSKVE